MAKRSKIARNRQRAETVARYAERRLELKRACTDPGLDADQRARATRALHRLPRNASPTRLRSRDAVDGRPRAVLRRFGVSRMRLRELAHAGHLPGVTKSSW